VWPPSWLVNPVWTSHLLVDAEPELEIAALGVVVPEDVGDVVGLVVAVWRDAAADRGMRDM
jgi:hypothetical protein